MNLYTYKPQVPYSQFHNTFYKRKIKVLKQIVILTYCQITQKNHTNSQKYIFRRKIQVLIFPEMKKWKFFTNFQFRRMNGLSQALSHSLLQHPLPFLPGFPYPFQHTLQPLFSPNPPLNSSLTLFSSQPHLKF